MKPIYVCDDANAHARDSNTKEQCAVCASKDLKPAFFAADIEKYIEELLKQFDNKSKVFPKDYDMAIKYFQNLAEKIKGA